LESVAEKAIKLILRHPRIAGLIGHEQEIHLILGNRHKAGLHTHSQIHNLVIDFRRPGGGETPYAMSCECGLMAMSEDHCANI
jgi:hypothetical protein